MKRIASCAFIFLFVTIAFAFNHPEIKWRSVSTAHFIINYYDRTEPAVYATWKIAEEAYASLSSLYDYNERDKIAISLADYDDYSNGFASWTNGSIMIWVTDIRFDLRGNNTWLNNVITHELSHIMTLEKTQKKQLLDWAFSFAYTSPNVSVDLAEPFATTRFFPEWLTEGIAQRESERRGNDCWDTKRDMLLRDAVLSNKALSLAEMGHFNHNSTGNELVYNQGFSFVKYVEDKIGTAGITAVFNNGRKGALISDNFYAAFEDQTGRSLEGLYGTWLDSLKTNYKSRIPACPTETTPVWTRGFLNAMPKISSNGKWWGWLTNDHDDGSRTDLVIAKYGRAEPFMTIKWALTSWDFSADSKQVYFIKSHETSDNGSYFNDLYVADIAGQSEKRLTRGARIYDVAACPDNQRIAAVQYRDGAFSIITMGLDGCCWETLAKGNIGQPFVGLSFSPVKCALTKPIPSLPKDSTKKDSVISSQTQMQTSELAAAPEYFLTTCKFINGKGTLCVVEYASGKSTIIGSEIAQEEYPQWSKDGRIYFDADYDGTFNIYSVAPDGSGLRKHTDAPIAMTYPFIDNNGKILCVSYGNCAFSIVSAPLTAGTPISGSKQYGCSFQDIPRPKGEVTIKSRPYDAKLLRSVWELQSAVQIDDPYGAMGNAIQKSSIDKWFDSTQVTAVTGFAMSRSDALEKKTLSFGIMGAAVHSGYARDTAKDTVSNNFSAFGHYNKNEYFSLLTRDYSETCAQMTARTLSKNLPVAEYFMRNSRYSQKATADSANSGAQSWLPLLGPSISYLNTNGAVSFGFNANVTVLYFIPYIFQLQTQATWQIARDFYAGIFPSIEIVPIAGFSIPQAMLPIVFTYSTSGYFNTDINYNLADVTQLQLGLMPESFMYNVVNLINDSAETRQGSGTTIVLSAMHGFGILKYSSVVVHTDDSYTELSDKLNDPQGIFPGNSMEYVSIDAGASVVFPMWRQINGGPAYADALYGEIGYDLQTYTNTTTLKAPFEKAFTNATWDTNHIFVGHVFSAGVKLGFFKSYIFGRLLSANAYWDTFNKKYGFKLSVN